VQLLGDHDQRAVRRRPVPEIEDHAEAFGDGGEVGAQRGGLGRPVHGEVDPHEEAPRGCVTELLALHDVAAVLAEPAGDRVHDAGPVRAHQQQDEVAPRAAGRVGR
jgi:hypothetical protein